MPVNPFFTPGGSLGSEGEKKLYEDLIVESIQVRGISVLYLPRTEVKMDRVYVEDPLVEFNDTYEIEMYLKSYDGFQGDGSFFSNMGVEIRDQVVFTVAIRRFLEEMGPRTRVGLIRPREGDLIWYPLNQKLFEIKFVEKFSMHYPLGHQTVYDLKCELFEYTGQSINTGIEAIDQVSGLTQDLLYWSITDESGNPLTTEDGDYLMVDDYDRKEIDPLDNSDQITEEADEVLDFDEFDVWTESRY